MSYIKDYTTVSTIGLESLQPGRRGSVADADG